MTLLSIVEFDGDGVYRHRSVSPGVVLVVVVDPNHERTPLYYRGLVSITDPVQVPIDRGRVRAEARLRDDQTVFAPFLCPIERNERGHLVMAFRVLLEAVSSQVDWDHPYRQTVEVAWDDGDDKGNCSAFGVGYGAVVGTGPQDPAVRRWGHGVARDVCNLCLPVDTTAGVDPSGTHFILSEADRAISTRRYNEVVRRVLCDVGGVVHSSQEIDDMAVVYDGGERRDRDRGRGRCEAASPSAADKAKGGDNDDGDGDAAEVAECLHSKPSQGVVRQKTGALLPPTHTWVGVRVEPPNIAQISWKVNSCSIDIVLNI